MMNICSIDHKTRKAKFLSLAILSCNLYTQIDIKTREMSSNESINIELEIGSHRKKIRVINQLACCCCCCCCGGGGGGGGCCCCCCCRLTSNDGVYGV